MLTPDIKTLNFLWGLAVSHTGRPPYHYEGGILEWGRDMTPEQVKAIKEESEVFLLLKEDKTPYAWIMADGYGQFREKLIIEETMSSWNCICPFLDDSLAFAKGVEFGILYQEMKAKALSSRTEAAEIENYFLKENQEQITLLVNRLKWEIVEMKEYNKDWIYIKMREKC